MCATFVWHEGVVGAAQALQVNILVPFGAWLVSNNETRV